MENFTEKYSNKIVGVLSCFDRIVITGTLPTICYSQGITTYLKANNIRIFDYPKFAEPFKNILIENAKKIAKENNIEIEYIRKSGVRKEKIISEIIKKRGDQPGLVHIISVMEGCSTYKPWHDKKTHQTYLRGETGKCLHYYFYFIDEDLGLCYVRVPTWCPFKLQVYFNGHDWLANKLKINGIKFSKLDNCFDYIEDFEKAQAIADEMPISEIHKKLNEFAARFCPVYKEFDQEYHYSIMQAEFATDIVFKQQSELAYIYNNLIATAIHTVRPENVATFLGQKLHSNHKVEIGNNYSVRIEGKKIKHIMGRSSIKMYDKFSKILRIETTTNDVTFFKHYREVEQRDGSKIRKLASLKKNIYSLLPLRDILRASNRRYLEFMSAIDDNNSGIKRLEKISKPVSSNDRNYKGFNFFDENDLEILMSISKGAFNINGLRSHDLKITLKEKSSSQITRILNRLRFHSLIKKVGKTYKYYLTKLGKEIILTGLKLKNLVVIPQLNY